MSALYSIKDPPNPKSRLSSIIQFALLCAICAVITLSSFTLFLPVQLNLLSILFTSSVLVPVILLVLSIFKPDKTHLAFFAGAFISVFSIWSYLLTQLDTRTHLMLIAGLMMLIVWHNNLYKQAKWLSLMAIVVCVLGLKLATPLDIKLLFIYALLLMASLLISSFMQLKSSASQAPRTQPQPLETDKDVKAKPEREEQPMYDTDIAMLHVADSSSDWEQILRTVYSELKTIHDVDKLFQAMLNIMERSIEFDAAIVGMIQDRSLKKIVSQGPEELQHSKNLNWTGPQVKQLLSKTDATLSQQEYLGDDNKQKKLYRIDIPVLSNNRPIGLVSILRLSSLFNEYDVKLASAIVFHSMVTLRQARMQDELKRQSSGSNENKTLFSREQFIQQCDKNLEDLNKPRVFSILIVEIDNYTDINDQHGQVLASKLYKTHASAIMRDLKSDDILGRYGKEGFLLMLHETDLLDAKNIAEKIRKKLSMVKIKNQSSIISSTVSIGLTTVSEQGEDMPSLIRKADMGLFVAKESGYNTVKVSL